MRVKLCLFLFVLVTLHAGAQNTRTVYNFDQGWEMFPLQQKDTLKENVKLRGASFTSQFNDEHVGGRQEHYDSVVHGEILEALEGFDREYPGIKDLSWEKVALPHPVRYEMQLNPGVHQFSGICYYRKRFRIPPGNDGNRLTLRFEGAMQTASVWINGKFVTQHRGGYLPFTVDLNPYLRPDNEIIVRLDNRDDPNTPPGKSLATLGFLYWSGLYRGVSLIATRPVYITDPTEADRVAGGGVFVRYENVSPYAADLIIRTNIKNAQPQNTAGLSLRQVLIDKESRQVALNKAPIGEQTDTTLEQTIRLPAPHLWYPDSPYLYRLRTEVWQAGRLVDRYEQHIGIRTLSFTRWEGFKINGRPVRIVGTNKHQDHPYIGNALSIAEQYRDLRRVKDAGFNFIRLAHYPNDPSVYNICDSLGIMLGDPIPGWQFFKNNVVFKDRVFNDIRQMIRRDRNHPSVIMWEVSLNESYPPDSFRIRSAAVAHEEYPGDQLFTSGDTYAAQKTGWDLPYNTWVEPMGRPQDVQPESPGFAREYGDYEFGGAGSTTRVNRGNGQKALLQNAWNLIWEHNLLRGPAYYPWTVGDANWAFYDGFETFTEGTSDWGVSDVFRNPKFSYYFFKSQQTAPPMVYLANWWAQNDSSGKVIVFSNCAQVALYVNGRLVGRQKPDSGPDSPYGDMDNGGNPFDGGNCTHLAHPPFTFRGVAWEPGELKAVGYNEGGQKEMEASVHTPGPARQIALAADMQGKELVADGADILFIHASLTDATGAVRVLDNKTPVHFTVSGPALIIGPETVTVRGGIATLMIRSAGTVPGNIQVSATGGQLPTAVLHLASGR